jgi:hypothetical protein
MAALLEVTDSGDQPLSGHIQQIRDPEINIEAQISGQQKRELRLKKVLSAETE